MKWWEDLVPKDGIVYDVGANTGDSTLWLADRCKFVYAFEPSPLPFAVLQKRIEGLQNVQAYPTGLFSVASRRTVFHYRHWTLLDVDEKDPRYHNTRYHPAQPSGLKGEFKANFTTLDIVTKLVGTPSPDFIQIDVDGHEYQVLLGGMGLLATKRPILYAEVGRYTMAQVGNSPEELFRYLDALDYYLVANHDESALALGADRMGEIFPPNEVTPSVLCLPKEHPAVSRWPRSA